jgi:hypothetical protein
MVDGPIGHGALLPQHFKETAMTKLCSLMSALSMLLTVNIADAASGHPTPFIGMNPYANNGEGMCHLIAADGATVYRGPGTIKLTLNPNFAIGSCMVKPDTDGDIDVRPAFVERDNVACHIRKSPQGPGFYTGFGGFTVTASGNVIARCKAELNPE